jgi:uncharacterized membrane protein
MAGGDVLETAVHVLHVILVGVWLGGVLFTTIVVSPALKEMKWPEAERVRVRSMIGRHYARVGSANLALLLVFAVLDGFMQEFKLVFYVEYTLMVVLFGLVSAHGAYFGWRLTLLAESERKAPSGEEAAKIAEERRSLGKLSLRVSQINLVVSAAVAVLAVSS